MGKFRYRPTPAKDQFAEMLAEGMSVPDIKRALGLTNSRAQKLMCSIRADLGPQAI